MEDPLIGRNEAPLTVFPVEMNDDATSCDTVTGEQPITLSITATSDVPTWAIDDTFLL